LKIEFGKGDKQVHEEELSRNQQEINKHRENKSDNIQKSLLKSDFVQVPPDHLFLDKSSNIGPLSSRWELDKFKKLLKQRL
jgi:hypothetical protein